ncbi:MAG: transcription termination factor NusA [Holosporales bacterium]|nr:transcription termination factor NusA [Holosporales bacterium]
MSRKIKLEENDASSIVRSEILQVADIVAKDKGIDKEDILVAMEQAILKTAQMKYGEERDLSAVIDRKTGDVAIYRVLSVVDDIDDTHRQITLSEAKNIDSNAKIGDIIRDRLPLIEFDRVAAQSARQVIMQRVNAVERCKQYEEFVGRVGEIITGIVKRVEYSDVILDMGKTEGILRKNDVIPGEIFRVGDRVKVLLSALNDEQVGPLLHLSRTNPAFLKKLFEQVVPEIYDGVIKIVAVARDPGSKAKVAVTTSDPNLDPVGACVGVRGARVQSVVDELKGEKIDIISWSDNSAMFIVNSLSPAEVSRIVMEETGNKVTAVVPNDQLSSAIGRRGQNVRLASRLTGYTISVTTEEEDAKARAQESARILKEFTEKLDVDDMVAHLLMSEGYSSIEDISSSSASEIASIDGFDEDIAAEIQQRAIGYMEKKKSEVETLCKDRGVSKELMEYELLRPTLLEALVKADVKTLDDLGDLSTDELLDISGDLLSNREASALIMKIRENWFK